ncbi:MAG: substrate-binding domain-containing protein [Dehalococcoidia bacterium]|nr:substrate-binding domain-containing protein [Dehalococcoidia bacterium]
MLRTLYNKFVAIKRKIHKIRKDSGFTQTDLAEAVGISRQAYTAIEAGKAVPSTEIALRLARALNTTVEELFWLDDDSDQRLRAELMDKPGSAARGTRIQLIKLGSRLLARPMTGGLSGSRTLDPADAISIAMHGKRQVDLQVLNESAINTPTLVLSGCDPSSSILASMIRDLGVRLIWIEAESMPSLHALARGDIHIAGCDFKDKVTGCYNAPLVKKIVPFPCTIIRFAIWRQGMIVSAGNPKAIRHVDDLAKPNVTFINRRPGAGSRGLLNRLMWETGISAEDIHGYDKTASGHLSIAETVATGLADCGIGIEAAARANDLDFLLLNEEPYDLVIPDHFLDLPAVQSLLRILKSRDLHRQVEALGGYDTSLMGIAYS